MSVGQFVSADPPKDGKRESFTQDLRVDPPGVGTLPQRLPPAPPKQYEDPTGILNLPPMEWWSDRVTQQVLPRERWVTFDLETVLLDTLANSPKILGVSYRASSTYQRIIEQDAAFDPTILLGGDLGATNDPVGNTLQTGGADRLREKSLNFRGGAKKTTRKGTELEWSQELGMLDSNSEFFLPPDQGNARLSLSLNKPMLSRGGRFYNERLITQARIENRVAWQDMRGEVEQRIADVIVAYWKLYEDRAQLTQQRELLARSRALERVLISRKDFDAALIEITKAKQRVARRADQLIDLEAELAKQQSRLATLIGSEALIGVDRDLELIPMGNPETQSREWTLRDAMAQALENRPEIRAAMHDVELSALELRVTRVELEPQLNWIFNGYLAQLNGGSQVARSFGEQFGNAPGVFTGLEFEVPRGRRAFRARHREALLRARERNEKLRETIQQTQFEVQSALIDLQRFEKQLVSKRNVLASAITEENILTVQWRIIGGDESRVGIKLENLLDAQQRRTDAEKDLVAVEVAYMLGLVQLQRATGTLLINEGIRPQQTRCSGEIHFLRDEYRVESMAPPEPVQEHEIVPGQATAQERVPTQEPALNRPLQSDPRPIVIEPPQERPSYANEPPRIQLVAPGQPPERSVPDARGYAAPPSTDGRGSRTNESLSPSPPTPSNPNQRPTVKPLSQPELLPPETGKPQLDSLPIGWNPREPSPWANPAQRLQMPAYQESETAASSSDDARNAWSLPAGNWRR